MNKFGTRLSLTSLDDRIVPSTTLADPGQSGVVNAVSVEGTGVGGVTTGPYRPSEGNSTAVVEFTGDAKPDNKILETLPDIVNDRREKPKKIDPAPTPRFINANGVEQPGRNLSRDEQAQNDKLRELAGDNIDAVARLDGQYDAALAERAKLIRDPRTTRKQLNDNAALLNSLNDQIYMLRRKGVEIRNALMSLKQAAENGYPEDALVVPEHVFNINRIGTADGGSTWIQIVLKDK